MAYHYDPPTGRYTSTIPPGVAVFRRVTAAHFGFSRTEVVRDQSRCRAHKSEHCECRGIDDFTTDLSPTGKGRTFFNWCVSVADPLGIQSVIFNRRVWGFGAWVERPYTGPSPHTDHVHVGLNNWAAAHLTEELIRAHLPGQGGDTDMDAEDKKVLKDIRDALKDGSAGATLAYQADTNQALKRIETTLTDILDELRKPSP